MLTQQPRLTHIRTTYLHRVCGRYVETDPATGQQKKLSLGDKEKRYLECLDSYYNEGGKQLLGDEAYEQLKLDLDFEGSRVATFSKDEIRFLLANKRYQMGSPVLADEEYNALRETLRVAGSQVVLHDAASCNLLTGVCKSDLRVDKAKTRLLYVPGTLFALLLFCELAFWTVHIDPLLSIVLGAVPAYYAGAYFTENIFAQQPLAATAACPSCNYIQPIWFGDLFNVQTDNILGKGTSGLVGGHHYPMCYF